MSDLEFTHTEPEDEYVKEFIQFCATVDGAVADLGCGSGHITKLLLKVGTKSVIANDVNEDRLKVFYKSLTEEETERAVALRGNALTLHKIIKAGTLGGILAANLLNFFQPTEVKEAFKLFFDLLGKNGKLCVIAFSSRCGLADGKRDVIQMRRATEEEWPGVASEEASQDVGAGGSTPKIKIFLDPEDLVREAELAGFVVEKSGFIPRPEYPEWFRFEKNPGESSGLIAVKPENSARTLP